MIPITRKRILLTAATLTAAAMAYAGSILWRSHQSLNAAR